MVLDWLEILLRRLINLVLVWERKMWSWLNGSSSKKSSNGGSRKNQRNSGKGSATQVLLEQGNEELRKTSQTLVLRLHGTRSQVVKMLRNLIEQKGAECLEEYARFALERENPEESLKYLLLRRAAMVCREAMKEFAEELTDSDMENMARYCDELEKREMSMDPSSDDKDESDEFEEKNSDEMSE